MSSDDQGSTRPSLVIERLGIDRLEGIDGSFKIDRLGPGINVIHGPNAIGKSRTAGTIQALIWPELADARAEIHGDIRIADTAWHIENRYARATYQRNGSPSAAPSLGFAPANQYDRYLLTLPDLLQKDDKHFAESIQRESAGGYDLNAARTTVGITATMPRPSSSKARKVLDLARARTHELKRADQALRTRERDRIELSQRLDHADAAASRVKLLELARDHALAITRRAEAEIERAAFEDPIGRMAGDEFDLVQAHDSRAVALGHDRGVLEAAAARQEEVLAETRFSDGLPEDGGLFRLSGLIASLKQVDADIATSKEAIATTQARLDQIQHRIAFGISTDQMQRLDLTGLRELGALTRRHQEMANRNAAQAELESWLGTVPAPANLDELERGAMLLIARLRLSSLESSSPREVTLQWSLIAAAAVVVIEAITLGMVSNSAWMALALIAIPLVWLALRRDRSFAREEAARLEQVIASLGVATPASWTPEQIEPILGDLQTRLAVARLDQQKAIRWESLAGRRAETMRLRDELAAARKEKADLLGVGIDSEEPEEIRVIADTIDRWRQVSEDLAAAKTAASGFENRRSALLSDSSQRLTTLGAAPVHNTSDAEIQVADVQRRTALAQKAHADVNSMRQKIADRIQPDIKREQAAIATILAGLGLDSRDDAFLRQLCNQVEECQEAQRALDEATIIEQTRWHALEVAPGLAATPLPDIESEMARARAQAAVRDDILEEITRLNHDLQLARQQTSLEQAIEQEAQALLDLRASRDRDDANVAAWRISEFVQGATRDLNRPTVFHAARSLFAQFTAGAWRLEMSDGSGPAFLAVETATNLPCNLNQLSSGTRVQLLMAVRIAFIETSEHGPQMPIILDETLGNADDLRANAIIDATIEIARRGRQVFYFTAQHDEIAKWQARIAHVSQAPDLQLIDLASIRNQSGADGPAPLSWERTIFERPRLPDGISHYDARAILQVAPVNLWSDHSDGVDLWYLIPDLNALTTLRQSGVRTWGQYRELLHHGGLGARTNLAGIHPRCEARLQAIEALRRCWQQGRPRPLTQEALLASGAITSTFVEPLCELATSCGWEATTIVQALRDKALPHFRNAVIEEMEESLRSEGHITDSEPMTDGAIRLTIQAGLQDAIASGIIDEEEVDDLLQSLAIQTDSQQSGVLTQLHDREHDYL